MNVYVWMVITRKMVSAINARLLILAMSMECVSINPHLKIVVNVNLGLQEMVRTAKMLMNVREREKMFKR